MAIEVECFGGTYKAKAKGEVEKEEGMEGRNDVVIEAEC